MKWGLGGANDALFAPPKSSVQQVFDEGPTSSQENKRFLAAFSAINVLDFMEFNSSPRLFHFTRHLKQHSIILNDISLKEYHYSIYSLSGI